MSVGSLLRSSYLRYFSKPAHERAIYQAIHRRPIRSIVEIGIDLAVRTPRLLEVASWQTNSQPIRYTGIDQFEARPPSQPKLSLKQAFTALRGSQVRVRLVPGEPANALAGVANALTGTDLLVISSICDPLSLSAAWLWIPRMLTAHSLILLEQPAGSTPWTWRKLSLADIQNLATAASKSRRQAA